MEEQVQNKPKKKTPLFVVLLWLISLLFCALLGAGAYWYYSTMIEKDNKVDLQPGPEETPIEEELEAVLAEVNYIRDPDSPNSELFTFQTKYPSNYVVINDDMQTEYITQGGMAPPVLTFYKPLSPERLNEKLDETSTITIWSTNGFSSIEDWLLLIWQIENFTPTSKKTATYTDYKFVIQEGTIENEGKPMKVKLAFIDLGNEVTYFFQATNDTIEDLNIILENFDTRENFYKKLNKDS